MIENIDLMLAEDGYKAAERAYNNGNRLLNETTLKLNHGPCFVKGYLKFITDNGLQGLI